MIAVGSFRQCATCDRPRPEQEFRMRVDETLSYTVRICRSCRGKLWDNPDNPHEGRRYGG